MENNLGVLQAVLIDPPVPPRVPPTSTPKFGPESRNSDFDLTPDYFT